MEQHFPGCTSVIRCETTLASAVGLILNRMIQYQVLNRTFSALSDHTRRDILTQLSRGPASVSELAGPSTMSLTGLKKHVQVLEEAELVVTEKVGRTRVCRLGPERLDEAAHWIDVFRARSEWYLRDHPGA